MKFFQSNGRISKVTAEREQVWRDHSMVYALTKIAYSTTNNYRLIRVYVVHGTVVRIHRSSWSHRLEERDYNRPLVAASGIKV